MPKTKRTNQTLTVADMVCFGLTGRRSSGGCTPEKLAAILREPFATAPGLPRCTVGQLPLMELPLNKRASRALKKMRVRTVGQLLDVRIETLGAQWSFGDLSIRHIHDVLVSLLLRPARGCQAVDFTSFDRMIATFVTGGLTDKRSATIARHRLGTNGRSATLAALGRQHGITRERVRQIETVALATLATAPHRLALAPAWKETWSILRAWSRPCPLDQLSEKIARRLKWPDQPDIGPLRRLMELHPDLKVSEADEVSLR